MERWNQIGETSNGNYYGCIEKYGLIYQAMLVVTNGVSWGVDPASVTNHPTFEAAAKELGIATKDFYKVEL